MKKIDEIFELFDGIIPVSAKKTIIFCEIEKTAYEIFYYSFSNDGTYRHSSEIVESGELDTLVVEKQFEKVAGFIRDSDSFDPNRRNVITITIEGTTEKVEVDQYDKNVGLYKIKKEWKSAHYVSI